MVKMLSAAGARNVEARVRSSERKHHHHHHSQSNHNSNFHNQERSDEWSQDGIDAQQQLHQQNHHGLRRSNSHNIDGNYKTGRSSERQRPTVLARPRLGTVVNREKIHDRFTLIKQRSINGMDSMKQRSKRGLDTVRERGAKVLPRKPNIRLKKSSAPKDLPTRSLFRHEPRTWFGAKKEKGDKVKEDWRNQRPTQSGGASNSNIPSKKEGATRGRDVSERVYHRKPSDQERTVRRSRSRSAARRSSYTEDDY
jgi:hypothetical protein